MTALAKINIKFFISILCFVGILVIIDGLPVIFSMANSLLKYRTLSTASVDFTEVDAIAVRQPQHSNCAKEATNMVSWTSFINAVASWSSSRFDESVKVSFEWLGQTAWQGPLVSMLLWRTESRSVRNVHWICTTLYSFQIFLKIARVAFDSKTWPRYG